MPDITRTLDAAVLQSLEAERIAALAKVRQAGWTIAGFVLALLVTVLLITRDIGPLSLIVLLGGGVGIFFWVYSSSVSAYHSGFKIWVVPRLVEACAQKYEGHLEYSRYDGISEIDFRSSGLFPEPDRYEKEDLVKGHVGETAVRFSEVKAVNIETRHTSRGNRKEEVTIFKGLFFAADFNKHFMGATYVFPDNAEPLLGRFGRTLQKLSSPLSGRSGELVQLEDPEFERAFAVYSTCQVEARYILSPSMMQRLTKFRQRCKTDISLAFCGGHLYIAIPLAVPWLEAPSLATPLTYNSLEPCLDQLRFALDIVHDLDLNTRIWSK